MAKGEITADEFNKALMDLGMTDVAKQAATSTSTIEGAMGNLEAAITGGLADALNLVKPLLTDSIGGAAELTGTFLSDATQALQSFIDGLSRTDALSAAATMFDGIGQALQTLGGTFGSVAEAVAPALGGLSDAGGIGQAVGDAFSTAAGFVTTVADALSAFGEWISANSEPIAAALAAIGGGFAAFKIASTISAVATALQDFSLASTAASVAQWALNTAMNANPLMIVVTAVGALAAALGYFFTQTETGRQLWSNFTSWLGTCVDNIIGFFSGLGPTIVGIFNSAANGARNAWNSVVGWFRGLPGTIGGFFSNAGSILVNAGANIINGFWAGLKSAWNNVTGWISGIGDWIKAHKGPISYDRRLLIPNGQAVMAGFAQGLTEGFNSDVTTAVAYMNARLPSLSPTLDPALRAADADGRSRPTTIVNVTVNGAHVIGNRDELGRYITRVLRDYYGNRGR